MFCILDDGLASCPVCSTRMKVELIDSHLNKCLIESSRKESGTTTSYPYSSAHQPTSTHYRKPSNKLERLPHLNYSLFRDAALRKKLQDLGISGQGSRQLLEKRHAEWVTLWNANCDSSNPRRKTDLLHELDLWERTQNARIHSSSSGLTTGSQLLQKDFDGPGWAAKHDQSFQDLIASARKKLVRKDNSEKTSSATKSLPIEEYSAPAHPITEHPTTSNPTRTLPDSRVAGELRQDFLGGYDPIQPRKIMPANDRTCVIAPEGAVLRVGEPSTQPTSAPLQPQPKSHRFEDG